MSDNKRSITIWWEHEILGCIFFKNLIQMRSANVATAHCWCFILVLYWEFAIRILLAIILSLLFEFAVENEFVINMIVLYSTYSQREIRSLLIKANKNKSPTIQIS